MRIIKGQIMKTKFILSTVVASLLLGSSALLAGTYQNSVTSKKANSQEAYLAKVNRGDFKKEVNQEETHRLRKIITQAVQTHKHSLQKAPKEFMNGLNETINAIQALRLDKTKDAQKALSGATKQFDTALKANPKLDLIPVADKIEVASFNGDAKLIKHIKDSAVKLLKDNDTQTAIDMLIPLQDEVVMRTQLVPAYLYPKATKEAAKDLKAGKKAVQHR